MDRFGFSFYMYFASLILLFLLVIWLNRVFMKGARKNQVNELLEAEKRYLNDTDIQHHGEDEENSPSARRFL